MDAGAIERDVRAVLEEARSEGVRLTVSGLYSRRRLRGVSGRRGSQAGLGRGPGVRSLEGGAEEAVAGWAGLGFVKERRLLRN